ncbi:uncharacterized protein TM35_000051440 [Trypanosoma theileri]|uniref:Uncharacterized protein n=1 Tax=Trypanosoma theileri TaxID=67003 RepID=A0A1X0P3Y6_9TRYP|nr:uncharacterized protein TM35_000051440 [Trypanosoma theileri]ORC91548.1 hypothetical protein TM35_000051440 [Trypanosoma theileri]
MSSIFSELRRSERLLPVEDNASFQRISSWQPLFVDPKQQSALYEHVTFFRSNKQKNSKWMHTVRSSRVSTRQVPFISLAVTKHNTNTNAHTTSSSNSNTRSAKTIEEEKTGITGTIMDDNNDYENTNDMPRLHVCHQLLAALAPYETLMCPTLLFSPFRPSFAKRMSLVAAQLSLPAHEVFLFVSMMLVYLDVTLSITEPKPLSFQELTDTLNERFMDDFKTLGDKEEDDKKKNEDPRQKSFITLLRRSIELWKERREATVTAFSPLGTLATALCLRDIHDTTYHAFVPCAPRGTKRSEHPFKLPPLPDDVLVSRFVPAWENILHAARRDVSVLATLQQHLLKQLRNPADSLSHMQHPTMGGNIFTSLNILPHSKEELADIVCRLGSSLWFSSAFAKSIVLSKAQLQFVSKTIQDEFFATSLRLRHRGVQEMRVRRMNLTDLALTVIQDDGREAEVGRPAGFVKGRTAMGDTGVNTDDVFDKSSDNNKSKGNLPLWVVAESGLDVFQTFVQHLLKSGKPTTSLMLTASQTNDNSTTNKEKDEEGKKNKMEKKEEQQFILLTRAEEGVLHRIFQSHRNALQLAGCGIQQLLLRVGDGQTFLKRVCGALIPWDIWDCYDEASQRSQLRRPVRIVMADAPLPLPDGVLPTRVTLRGVRGMVQHYWKALLTERRRTASSRRPALTSTTLFPIDKLVALYVLRHHPQYYTRMRGCGIVEVCVQQKRCQTGSRTQFATLGGEGETTTTSTATTTGRGRGRKEEIEEEDDESGMMMGTTCEYAPTLAIIHPCGGVTVFAYEDCFTPVTGTLNRPQLLDDGNETIDTTWCSSAPSRKRAHSP